MISRNLLLLTAALAIGASTAANAAGTITNGAYTVGIGNNGELFDGGAYVGFQRLSDNYDPLSPGSPRDSWGITTDLGSAYADDAGFGSANISSTSFGAFGGASTTALSSTGVGVDVAQSYSFAAANIVRITHTVTNTTDGALSVIFQRNWDTDIDPTFNNDSFNVGASPQVIDSSWYGFESPDPAFIYNSSCLTGCNESGDNGGGIKISLGTLAAFGSTSFDYWYGISETGQDVDQLIAQAQGVGVGYLIASQSIENGQYPILGSNSAFIGVAGVPEPASWALMITGFGLTGAGLRRRRNVPVAA